MARMAHRGINYKLIDLPIGRGVTLGQVWRCLELVFQMWGYGTRVQDFKVTGS